MKITYVVDDPKLKGSANAIIHAHRKGVLFKDECIVAYYGDILSNLDLQELVDHHLSSGAAATVAMARRYKIRVGTAEVEEDGRISRFIEKPELKTPACIGILAMSGETLEDMDTLSRKFGKETLDLMGDVILYLIQRGRIVNAYVTDAFWYDLGSIERYEKLSNSEVEEQLSFLTKK